METNSKDSKVVYDYIGRSEVIGQQLRDTLNYMYSIARPVCEKSFMEICKELNEECKAENGDDNWRKTYCDGKYTYPGDFFYVPHAVQKTILENRQEAYGISTYWDSDMKFLLEILYNGGGMHEVNTPTEWSDGKNVRHCIKVDTINKIIGEEPADKLKEVLEGYKRTYRFGLRDVNQFVSLVWAAPSTNRETVKKAWKDAFSIDVEIPEDDAWVDVYYESDKEEDSFEESETND